jgi:hypothetical protein
MIGGWEAGGGDLFLGFGRIFSAAYFGVYRFTEREFLQVVFYRIRN